MAHHWRSYLMLFDALKETIASPTLRNDANCGLGPRHRILNIAPCARRFRLLAAMNDLHSNESVTLIFTDGTIRYVDKARCRKNQRV